MPIWNSGQMVSGGSKGHNDGYREAFPQTTHCRGYKSAAIDRKLSDMKISGENAGWYAEYGI